MRNREILGLKVELVGLVFALVAAIWQAKVSDWFETNSREWTNKIQGDVNTAIFTALDQLSEEVAATSESARSAGWGNVQETTNAASMEMGEEQDKRKALATGQGRILGNNVRFWLFFIGAALVVVGKGLVISEKKRRELPPANSDTPPNGTPLEPSPEPTRKGGTGAMAAP